MWRILTEEEKIPHLQYVDQNTRNNAKAMVCAMFFAYALFAFMLIWDALTPVKDLHLRIGLKHSFSRKKLNEDKNAAQPLEQEPKHLESERIQTNEIEENGENVVPIAIEEYSIPHIKHKGFTTCCKDHYQRNMFFFYLACGVAFLAGPSTGCVTLAWFVLLCKLIQILAIYFEITFVCYITGATAITFNILIMMLGIIEIFSQIP